MWLFRVQGLPPGLPFLQAGEVYVPSWPGDHSPIVVQLVALHLLLTSILALRRGGAGEGMRVSVGSKSLRYRVMLTTSTGNASALLGEPC